MSDIINFDNLNVNNQTINGIKEIQTYVSKIGDSLNSIVNKQSDSKDYLKDAIENFNKLKQASSDFESGLSKAAIPIEKIEALSKNLEINYASAAKEIMRKDLEIRKALEENQNKINELQNKYKSEANILSNAANKEVEKLQKELQSTLNSIFLTEEQKRAASAETSAQIDKINEQTKINLENLKKEIQEEELSLTGRSVELQQAFKENDAAAYDRLLKQKNLLAQLEQKQKDLETIDNRKLTTTKTYQDLQSKKESIQTKLDDEETPDWLKDSYKEQLTLVEDSLTQTFTELLELNKQEEIIRNSGGPELEYISNVLGEDGIKFITNLSSPINAIMTTATAALGNIFTKGFDKLTNAIDSGITSAVQTINDNMGRVDSRLVGTDINFQSILNAVGTNYSTSAFVKQTDLLNEIVSLVDKGIVYNLEERALYNTLSDRLISTFDRTNSTLDRLIRIQQADSTQYAIGAESLLTQFFNSNYVDSSYMTDMYDNVYSTLSGTMANKTNEEAAELNFAVQKWLGSLYSLGLSSSTVSSLASAINSLSTGNLSSLSGSSAEKLIVAASNASGKSYADYLTNGLTVSDINSLFKSIVEYLQNISENTSSNVLKSTWSNILGIDISDWKALSNVSAADLNQIYNYNSTVQDMTTSLQTQLSAVSDRTHISSMVDTFISNLSFGMGQEIATDQSKYLTHYLGNLVSGIVGENTTVGKVLSAMTGISDLINGVSVFAGNDSQLSSNLNLFQNIGSALTTNYDLITTNDDGIAGALASILATPLNTITNVLGKASGVVTSVTNFLGGTTQVLANITDQAALQLAGDTSGLQAFLTTANITNERGTKTADGLSASYSILSRTNNSNTYSGLNSFTNNLSTSQSITGADEESVSDSDRIIDALNSSTITVRMTDDTVNKISQGVREALEDSQSVQGTYSNSYFGNYNGLQSASTN